MLICACERIGLSNFRIREFALMHLYTRKTSITSSTADQHWERKRLNLRLPRMRLCLSCPCSMDNFQDKGRDCRRKKQFRNFIVFILRKQN